MKSHLRYLLYFLLPILFLGGTLECLLRTVPSSYETKRQQIDSCANDIGILFLGPSHIYMGVRPSLMKVPAYNLAQVSQSGEYDLKLLKDLRKKQKLRNLHTVVLNIDAGILFDVPLRQGGEAFRLIYYRRYMDLDNESWISLNDFEVSSFTNVKMKIASLGESKDSPDCDAFGWYKGYDISKKEAVLTSAEFAEATVKKHIAGGLDAARANMKVYRELVAYCKAQNWDIVILRTPCTADYMRFIPAGYEKCCTDLLYSLQKDYGVRIGDYSRDTRFAESDFYDCDHLTNEGARRFTEILCQDFGW